MEIMQLFLKNSIKIYVRGIPVRKKSATINKQHQHYRRLQSVQREKTNAQVLLVSTC